MRDGEILYAALVVSPPGKMREALLALLPECGCGSVRSAEDVSSARRILSEFDYDFVFVNSPLPDENGLEISLDIIDTSNASVLLVVSKESYDDITDRVTDYGVLVLAKPFHWRQIDKAIRFLTAIQNKRHQLEYKMRDLQDKMEDLRTVAKAKCMLIEKKHMTEDQAHRFIGKTAMDHGISRKRAAIRIMDDL